MSRIRIALFDTRSMLLLDALGALLDQCDDFDVVVSTNCAQKIVSLIKTQSVNIAILVWHEEGSFPFDLVETIRRSHPAIAVALVCMNYTESLVQHAIRKGIHGIITHQAGAPDLYKAVYTLRNGHDFLDDSISHILLQDYIESLKIQHTAKNEALAKLSSREIEILTLWGEGRTNKQIADSLFISVRTVESHKNHIMQKLKLKTTVDLMKFAIRNGITSI